MNYISLDNLTRYHRNFRNYGDATYALTRGSLWKQTEKAGAVTCWPIGNSRLKPVVEFKFKETLPVSDKSEQNPSTITGVSSIKMTRCGANWFSTPYYRNTAGQNSINTLAWEPNADGTVRLVITNPSSGAFYYMDQFSNNTVDHTYRRLLPIGKYRVSLKLINGTVPNGAYVYMSHYSGFFGDTTTIVNTQYNQEEVFNVSDSSMRHLFLFKLVGNFTADIVVRPVLTILSDASDAIEQYTGTNYTFSLGSTYYGGTLDVTSGKLTVTHRMIEPDSLTIDISNYPAYLPLECTDTFGRTITSTGNILALTGSTGGKIVYKLANPYTVQIDPVTITALSQVDKYTPRINTLYTDAENITVGYQKSPIRDEYEKVQAIIANGGTI